jgi:hypothetical protein
MARLGGAKARLRYQIDQQSDNFYAKMPLWHCPGIARRRFLAAECV